MFSTIVHVEQKFGKNLKILIFSRFEGSGMASVCLGEILQAAFDLEHLGRRNAVFRFVGDVAVPAER